MIRLIFSVFDQKTNAYLDPVYYRSKGEAVRAMRDALANEDHQFAKHAEDYTLFELGDFDDTTGSFNLYNTPQALAKAIELKQEV